MNLPKPASGSTYRMTVASRLLLTFLLTAILPMSFCVAFALLMAEWRIAHELTQKLEIAADAKVQLIETYQRDLKRSVVLLSGTTTIQQAFQEFANHPRNENPSEKRISGVQWDLVEKTQSDFGFSEGFLLSPQGDTLHSLGTPASNNALGDEDHGREKVILNRLFHATKNRGVSDPVEAELYIDHSARTGYAAAPIYSEGKLAGVLVVSVSNARLNEILNDRSPLGDTCDTIVTVDDSETNRDANVRRIGLNDSMSYERPSIEGARVGHPGRSGGIQKTSPRLERQRSGVRLDPNGRQVLAAWRLVPSLNWMVMVKIPTSYAFAPVRRLKELVVASVLLSLVIAAFCATILSRTISRPIRTLTDLVNLVAGGDLTTEVSIEGPEEIGSLCIAFNKMTARLRELYETIEDQVRDRSEKLVQTERKVTYLLNASAEAIYAIDTQGVCTFCNPACVKLLGYHEESELVGKIIHEIICRKMDDGILSLEDCPVCGCLVTAEKRHFEGEEFRRADGSHFPVEYWAHPLSDDHSGRVTGAVVNFLDITDRLSARKQLMVAKDSAEEGSRIKSQFLANVSHELRTPLNAIIGYSEMLLEETEATLEMESLVPDLNKIHIAGKHLLELINAVLDLTKIESGKVELHIEELDVPSICRDVLALVSTLARKNNNTLRLILPQEGLGEVHADSMKLRQSLINLLSNACKFTENGEVSLRGRRQTDDDGFDWLLLEVKDTGIGLDESQMGRLFQAFSQADASTTRKYGGTGLGLVISRRFCRLMGGDINLKSKLGSGSTFTIKIPAFVPDSLHFNDSSGRFIQVKDPKGTILVIDDDPSIHDMMRRTFAREGYRVETASNGQAGLERIRELKPDAVTLDVMMPGLDGWAVLSQLKADPGLEPIPVLMMTIVDHRETAIQLGADEFLTKPVDRNKVRQWIRGHQNLRETPEVLIVENDRELSVTCRRLLEVEGYHVQEADSRQSAIEKICESKPDLILMNLVLPNLEGFHLFENLLDNEDWRNIPVVILTSHQIDGQDQKRVAESVRRILELSRQRREASNDELGAFIEARLFRNSVSEVS